MRRRRGHGARNTLLVLVLGAFAVVAALAWLAEHLIVFTGVALIAGGAFHLGQRRRVRPGQVMPRQARPEAPAAAGTVPAATLPLAVPAAAFSWDQDDQVAPQPLPGPPGRPDRDSLIATPMSGARPLWGPE